MDPLGLDLNYEPHPVEETRRRLARLTSVDVEGAPPFYTYDEVALHRQYVCIGESTIPGAGVGVFTKVDVPKGTCVGAAHGPEVEVEVGGEYSIKKPRVSGWVVEELTGPLRFLNNSPQPNVVLRHQRGRTLVYALVDMPPACELLMDYSTNVEVVV